MFSSPPHLLPLLSVLFRLLVSSTDYEYSVFVRPHSVLALLWSMLCFTWSHVQQSRHVVAVNGDQSSKGLARLVLVTVPCVEQHRAVCFGEHYWSFISNMLPIRVSTVVAQLVQCGQILTSEWRSGSTCCCGVIDQTRPVQCGSIV